MDGPVGDPGPIWISLSSGMSPTHVLGVVLLGLFLVLHVIIVRLVVRPIDGSDQVATTRDTRVTRPTESAPKLPAEDRPLIRPGRRTHHVAHGPGSA